MLAHGFLQASGIELSLMFASRFPSDVKGALAEDRCIFEHVDGTQDLRLCTTVVSGPLEDFFTAHEHANSLSAREVVEVAFPLLPAGFSAPRRTFAAGSEVDLDADERGQVLLGVRMPPMLVVLFTPDMLRRTLTFIGPEEPPDLFFTLKTVLLLLEGAEVLAWQVVLELLVLLMLVVLSIRV